MLVLSRQLDQTIEVYTASGVIEVTVVRSSADSVRLGFTAPGSVQIDRKEVAEARRRDEAAAVKAAIQLKGRNP